MKKMTKMTCATTVALGALVYKYVETTELNTKQINYIVCKLLLSDVTKSHYIQTMLVNREAAEKSLLSIMLGNGNSCRAQELVAQVFGLRGRQSSVLEARLQSEFQFSQDYTEKPYPGVGMEG